MDLKFEIAVNRQFINKLGKGDPRWGEYNDTFENVFLTQVELRQEIRKGHAITSPHHHERHTLPSGRQSAYRHSLNWISSQHLGLDHDDLGFDAVLELNNGFVCKHGSFIYTTPSHTPQDPRTRTIFLLERPITDKDEYAEASAALHWKFAGYADSSCTDLARNFFGSKDCEIRNINKVLPMAVLDELRAEFCAAMEAERANRKPASHYQASTPELAKVQEAMRFIPKQPGYHDWLDVLMAVHSEFPGSDGVAICESWSPGFPDEIERKFASFNRNGNGTGKVGIGTVFHMAQQCGWQKPVPVPVFSNFNFGMSSQFAQDESEDDNDPIVSIVGEVSDMPPLPEAAHIDPEVADGASPWLDDYIEHSRGWSPRAYDGFHEATGLWVASTVAARRIRLDVGGERYTNLAIALAARTSVYAKTTTAKVGMDALSEAGLTYLLAPDDATPQAFIKNLAARVPADWGELPREKQLQILERVAFAGQKGWFFDEFGQKVSAMMREGGHMADFRGLLRKFDDTPATYEYVSVSRGSDVITAPYLALLANLTPADLKPFAKKGASLWGDGFWARFAFITPPPDEPRKKGRFPEGKRVTPPAIVAKLKEWHNRLGIPTPQAVERLDPEGKGSGKFDLFVEAPAPRQCILGEGVFEAFYRYHDALLDIVEQSSNHDLDGNYSRMAEKALRVAMLLGSLENYDQIEIRHWARAQQITESWRQNLHHLYTEVTGSEQSRGEEVEGKIMKLIVEKGGEQGLTKRDIHRGVRGVDSNSAGIILQSMVNADLLEMVQEGKAIYYKVAG
jgi:hypothetical protein